jgi:hypothetical protein
MNHRIALLALAIAEAGCVGTTGGDLLEFDAFAAGPEDAAAGASYAFVSGRDYQVSLTRARLHVGAVYMNQSVPTSVASDTSCTLAGTYVAEVTEGLDIDVLSPDLQRFPARGTATTTQARAGEVWLTGGDVDEESDPTVILDVAGTAEKDGASFPFEAALTIGQNRVIAPSDPAQPGARPICKQRIVTPIDLDITPSPGGRLVVRIDPRDWFGNVDFAGLEPDPDDPPLYRFSDDSTNPPSKNLYNGLRANAGVYSFHWERSSP